MVVINCYFMFLFVFSSNDNNGKYLHDGII